MSIHADTESREDEDESTRIKVSGATADDLYELSSRRETYEDVIRRLINNAKNEGDRR